MSFCFTLYKFQCHCFLMNSNNKLNRYLKNGLNQLKDMINNSLVKQKREFNP